MATSMRVPSGGEPLEEPRVAGLATEAEPVVEPARPPLPKLDPIGLEAKASPVFGPWDRCLVGMGSLKLCKQLLELLAAHDDLALR